MVGCRTKPSQVYVVALKRHVFVFIQREKNTKQNRNHTIPLVCVNDTYLHRFLFEVSKEKQQQQQQNNVTTNR